jgi:hypothetical protein
MFNKAHSGLLKTEPVVVHVPRILINWPEGVATGKAEGTIPRGRNSWLWTWCHESHTQSVSGFLQIFGSVWLYYSSARLGLQHLYQFSIR